MNKSIVVRSKKTFFKAKHFVITETLVKAGNRQEKRFDVERKPTVAILPVTEDGKVYLIREYRYLYKKTMLGIVAGFVEENEKPLIAAKRELQEETGLKAKKWKKMATIEMARSVVKATTHLFLATGLEQKTSSPDFDEDITVVKIPLTQLVEDVMYGKIHTAISMIAILMLDKLLKQSAL